MKPYYEQDGITIYNGNCLDIMPSLAPVELIATDPPYGVAKTEWDGMPEWEILLAGLGERIKSCITEEGVAIVFCATRFLDKTIRYMGLPYRWLFIWHCSNNMIPGDIGFAKYTAAPIFSNRKSVFVNAQDLRHYPAGTAELKNNGHPTPKPVEIMAYLISHFCKEGGSVLDPCSGSGSTLVAAKRCGRKAIGIEINSKYCDLAIARLSQTELFGIAPAENAEAGSTSANTGSMPCQQLAVDF